MPAIAGPPPWSHEQYWQWRDGFRKVTKATQRKLNAQHTPSGWRAASANDTWDNDPKHSKTKQVQLANGITVDFPDGEYDDYIGYRRTNDIETNEELANYIEAAFAKDKKIDSFEAEGHISKLEYYAPRTIMRATFKTNGAIVVYMRVPQTLYVELKTIAAGDPTGGPDGTHLLGQRFWDLVRIRGQRTGSRYRYEYTDSGSYEPKGSKFERTAGAFRAAVEDVVKKDVTQKDKSQKNIEKEAIEDLDMFIRSLSDSARKQYKALDGFANKYRFLKNHGIDLPTEEELLDPDF